MKRLFTALAVTSMVGFAMPTLAAPRIIEKRQLSIPQLPLTIQRRLTSSAEWPKHPTEVQGPELTGELICSGITYRLWQMRARTVGEQGEVDLHDGYIYQAIQRGVSRWHLEQETSRPGLGPFNHGLVACADGGIAIHRENVGFAEPLSESLALRKTVSRSESNVLRFDQFSAFFPWTVGRDSLTAWAKIDGVLQQHGILRSVNENGSIAIKGDSRIFLIENGRIVVHRPPWYRNLQEMNLTPEQRFTAVYYKLSDGYGVAEEIFGSDGLTVTTTVRYYRIRNGETQYHEVPSLPWPSIEILWRIENGLELNAPTEKILLHGLPPVCTSSSCQKISAHGWIVKEDSSKKYIRYFITRDGKPTQYWEAVIQK